MYLVTGITGHVGGATARHLLQMGKQVRALVRNPAKAAAWKDKGVELVQGEWEDAAALAQALQGVEGAYLMMAPTLTPSPDFREAKALTASYKKALAQTPPPKLVVLSSMGSEKTSGLGLITGTHLLEQGLADLPFPVALVRAGGFFENQLPALQAAQSGTIPTLSSPTSRKTPMIATDDIGAEIAKLLTTQWTGRRIIELGSLISPDDVAAAIGQVLGRDVKAQAIPRAAWTETLEQHMGFPKGGTSGYEEMADGINSGWIGFGVEGTERVEGTTTAKEFFIAANEAGNRE